jgi:ElaB/YqjD/DUF883 family membrane-anchored ribosome-binding protein
METTSNEFERDFQPDAPSLKNGASDTARRARSAVGQEVTNLIADVEDLIARLSNSLDPEIARARTKIERAIKSTKHAVSDGATHIRKQARDALDVSDQYVRTSPWQAIGIAAVAGLVVGFLTFRR